MTTLAQLLVQPVPEDYMATEWAMWAFTIWAGGMAIVVLPFVFKRLRDGDPIPGYIWIGGLITSVAEPMLDHLGHLWWPTNLPGPSWVGYDLDVPWLIPPCYVFFIAMTGYWVYTKMLTGLKVKHVFIIFAIAGMRDVILEYPGLLLDVYTYYGDVPFKIGPFPWFWVWANGTAMLTVGFVLWLAAPHLTGRRKPFAMLIPIVGFMGSYGIVGTPYFAALNWPMSTPMQYVFTLWSLGMAILVVRVIAFVVSTRQSNTLSELGWEEHGGVPPEAKDHSVRELLTLRS